MNDQLTDPIEAARRSYAEELRFTAHIRSRAVFTAFAAVPRERFVGAGPWRVRSPMDMAEYWTTEDGDPRAVYHDVLIALDERRQINNGQPSLWAFLLDQLDVAVGEQAPALRSGAALMLAADPRAVQRSIYDTHSEDGTDAAKGDAMASVCDIVNAIEAQDVGGERAQACKDAGIASDAAGVFCEATVADVVRAVLDAPVVADGLGALSGRQHDVTDEQCGFAG